MSETEKSLTALLEELDALEKRAAHGPFQALGNWVHYYRPYQGDWPHIIRDKDDAAYEAALRNAWPVLRREFAAMAGMKADAGRYQWLRSDSDWDYPIVRLHYGDYSVAQGNELDAAIDAAIANARGAA